jgi:hypothetical protein
MTDKDLGELIALLQNHSGISRVTYDEIAKGIRFAESQGWKIAKPGAD